MNLPFPDSVNYLNKKPFPYLVIDDAFEDHKLWAVLKYWPLIHDGHDTKSKKSYTNTEERMRGYIADFIKCTFQSQKFISFLEALTGITGLVMPWHGGPALHETFPGGALPPHLDYTIHNSTGLQHRVNAILFLNENWKPEYNGSLQLFSHNVSYAGHLFKVEESIPPKYNRLVVFNINENAWHGHPSPLACPNGMSRKSIALNYFSAPEEKAVNKRTTFSDEVGFVSRMKKKIFG
jgi:hypothetical protein